MSETQRILPNKNVGGPTRAWHDVFGPEWRDMIGLGYVPEVICRVATFYVSGLANLDGECSLFGDDISTPHARQLPVSAVNREFFVVSESALDVQGVRIWGVSEDGDEIVRTTMVTGTTPASLGSDMAHVNFAMYMNGETMNQGDIIVSTKSDAGIPTILGDEMQLSCHIGRAHGTNPKILTPNDQVFVFCETDLTSDKSDGVHLRLYNLMPSGHKMMTKQWLLYENSFSDTFCVPLAMAAGEFFEITAERSSAGAGNVALSANVTMYIMKPTEVTQAGNSARADVSGLFRPID